MLLFFLGGGFAIGVFELGFTKPGGGREQNLRQGTKKSVDTTLHLGQNQLLLACIILITWLRFLQSYRDLSLLEGVGGFRAKL